MNSMIGLLVPALLGVDLGSAATERTANYQPPGSPGGSNNWATSTGSPTTARWPAAPTNIPTSTPTMTENPRYGTPTTTMPTPVPTTASSSSSLPNPFNSTPTYNSTPTSTSGFPMNSATLPPPTNGGFPGSTLGTLPSSTLPGSSTTSSSAAWPTTTAPPSLGTGPRVAQPQNWPTVPRETTITARMPAEPNLTTPNLGANYNNYQQPTTNPYQQQQPGTWGQGQQVAQYSPNPTNTAGQQQFPQNNPGVGQPIYAANPQQQNPNGMNPNGVNPNLVNNAATIQKEPASATDKQAAKPVDTSLTYGLIISILLCTSVACNLYFGWSKYQMQERYRLLLVDRGAYSS